MNLATAKYCSQHKFHQLLKHLLYVCTSLEACETSYFDLSSLYSMIKTSRLLTFTHGCCLPVCLRWSEGLAFVHNNPVPCRDRFLFVQPRKTACHLLHGVNCHVTFSANPYRRTVVLFGGIERCVIRTNVTIFLTQPRNKKILRSDSWISLLSQVCLRVCEIFPSHF